MIISNTNVYRSSVGAVCVCACVCVSHCVFWVHLHNLFPEFISIVSPHSGEAPSQIMSRSVTLQNTNHQIGETFPLFTFSLSLTLPLFFLAPSFSLSWMTLTDRLVATGTTPCLLCCSEAGRCEIHNKMARNGSKPESISKPQQTVNQQSVKPYKLHRRLFAF